MQLYLEVDQLNLLANILLERVCEMSVQTPSGIGLNSEPDTQQNLRRLNELLDKVLARNLKFDSDELEQLADLLSDKKIRIKSQIARQYNAALKKKVEQKLALLERALERVEEACAMV
jgi:hypothetical protein